MLKNQQICRREKSNNQIKACGKQKIGRVMIMFTILTVFLCVIFAVDLISATLIKGTNAGFVIGEPTANPSEGLDTNIDNEAASNKYVANKSGTIIQIGWWCNSATQAADFEVGIYDHDSGSDKPDNLLGKSAATAKGTDGGWKNATVDIDVTNGATYWIAVQLDDTATITEIQYKVDAGEKMDRKEAQTTLTDPWGTSDDSHGSFRAVYALYGEGEAETVKVYLETPADNSQEISPYIFFNSTLDPLNLNITNATLKIWYSNGSEFHSNYSFVGATSNQSTTWNISNFGLGTEYDWNVQVYTNASGNDVWGTNRTFTASVFSETATHYNWSIWETSRQTFELQILGISTITSATAVFWYNGTSYVSDVTDYGGGVYNATNTIDIPLTKADGNKSFWWEWDITTTTQTLNQNSTSINQEVNRTHLVLCNVTYNTSFINFTTKNGTNPYPNLNATFKSAWDFWFGGGNVKRNYSYEDTTETNYTFDFCMFPADKTFTVDADIEFDSADNALNYHYLDNANLSNTTNLVNLYLLADDLATLTVLKVQDEAQRPMSNVVIQIQLYDIGTDTYYTVGMAKTSFNGEDITYLNWYDSFYKFILTRNGEVLKTTTPYKISETPQTFNIITAVTYHYDRFRDFVYSLIYNEATENFVLTFTKPSGLVDEGCLRVIKRSMATDTEICDVCTTSSSATLYCNIAGYGNGTYIASFYATGTPKFLVDIIDIYKGSRQLYGYIGTLDASVYAFLLSGIVVAMFFVSPVLAIVGLLLGLVAGMVLGFQAVNYFAFAGIAILGFLVIWVLKR